MQINQLTFAFLNKHRLWSFSAAVALRTSTTSLGIIKDVIKHHQSRMRNYEQLLNAWAISDTLESENRRCSGLSLQTQEHGRPVSSCQVKGQINRVTVGMPQGHAKAGCCFLLCRLERWPHKLHQRGTCGFPAQRSHGIGEFTTQ